MKKKNAKRVIYSSAEHNSSFLFFSPRFFVSGAIFFPAVSLLRLNEGLKRRQGLPGLLKFME